MDGNLVESLEAALAATPDNVPLRITVAKLCFERGDAEKASDLIAALASEKLMGCDERLFAAEVELKAARPSRALAWLGDSDPRELVCKARAYSALGEREQGRVCYQKAVAENGTLEDVTLAETLGLSSEKAQGRERPKLRVVSNDDTRESEVVRFLQPAAQRITFADVGGLDEVKKQIRRKIITPFQKPSLFSRFKKQAGGGILLYGPPGCGKTLLARATAGECNARFFNVLISDILDMYIGESEAKLHAIFGQARQSAPAVLFFDEVEALAGKRQNSREGASSRVVSQFLSELDGFAQNNHGVLVIAATNVPWALDPAFRRPGRMDRSVFIAPPDLPARVAILKLLLVERPGGETIDINSLAKQTSGFSGADLRNVIESAVDEAIDDSVVEGKEIPLAPRHVHTALKEVGSTTLEWLTTARNYARYANDAGQYNDVLEFLEKHGKGI